MCTINDQSTDVFLKINLEIKGKNCFYAKKKPNEFFPEPVDHWLQHEEKIRNYQSIRNTRTTQLLCGNTPHEYAVNR